MSTLAQRTPFLPIRLLDRLALPVSRTFHNPSNRNSVLSVSSRSHSPVKHISHDRLYSNSTHPHCRSPAGPRAVSPARLQLVSYGRSAFLRRSPYHYLFPIVALLLLAAISSSCLTHLPLSLRQLPQNPTSSYPHALQSDREPRGASTDPRRPGVLQLGSLSCWVHQFRKHAGKAISKNQLAASSGPAGTAATAAWHGFQRPVCIVPPTFHQKNWYSALCLAFLHIPVRAATLSAAGNLPRHMSKHAGADPARSAPQPAPQTIRAAGTACAVATQTPAGAKRCAAQMLPSIHRRKWGQHLYPLRSGWQSRASAQTAISWLLRCVDSASRFSASVSWTTTAPSNPGRTFQIRHPRPRVPRPAYRLLPLRLRPPPATQAHTLNPSGRFDMGNGRSLISTTGLGTRRTPLAPPLTHPPPHTRTSRRRCRGRRL
jgi:hypothetical protein